MCDYAARSLTTPPFTPKSTEPHPQDTAAQAEHDSSALTYTEGHAGGSVLMVIEAPVVLDAEGNSVPAHLSAGDGSTVTLSITPEGTPRYPLVATESVAVPSEAATAAKTHAVRYGLSDPKAPVFQSLDPKLKTGSGKLHIGIARYVAPYDTASHPKALKELVTWLQAVAHAGLRPYLTLGTLIAKLNARRTAETEHNSEVKSKKEGAEEQVIPGVQLWGAWNEPDLNLNKKEGRDLLYNKAPLAARYWEIAQEVIRCRPCRVVAGEFAEDSDKDHVGYIKRYLNHILTDHYHHAHKPRNIGFHDYRDLVHVPESLAGYSNPAGRKFLQLVRNRFGGHAHILFSEQGGELEDNHESTRLNVPALKANHRQLLAAEDFPKLGKLSRNLDVLDYYLYSGPTKAQKEKNPHAFDSALLDGDKTPPADRRPAYCYLVLDHHGCPAKGATNGKRSVPRSAQLSSGAGSPRALADSASVR